jgi:hypothetical protein
LIFLPTFLHQGKKVWKFFLIKTESLDFLSWMPTVSLILLCSWSMKKLLSVLILAFFVTAVSAQNFTTVYEWMYDNWLTTMTSEEAFRPNDGVSRGEIAKFFAQFAELKGLSKTKSAEECVFNDVDGYDSTLVPHIIAACQYGLVKGSQGNYMPNKALTEAEALTVVIRALMGVQDETKNPRWSEYHEVGKWLGILDNETVWDLNTSAMRGKVGTWLWRAIKADVDAAQQEWTDELKSVLTEIFGEEFWQE